MTIFPLIKLYKNIFIRLSVSCCSTELVVVNTSYSNEKYSLKTQMIVNKIQYFSSLHIPNFRDVDNYIPN